MLRSRLIIFSRAKLVLFVGVTLIQIPSLTFSVDVNERPTVNDQRLSNLLGYKPINHSKWPEIESDGKQELLIIDDEINLMSSIENKIAINVTAEEGKNNNVVIVNTAQDRDIKYEIDKKVLNNLLANTNNNTVNIFGDSQSNNYNAVIDLATYNSIIKSIMNFQSTDRARGIVKIDGVVHLVPGGIENINKGISSARYK